MKRQKDIILKQANGLASIKIDTNESDCVLLWYQEKGGESNLVLVDRKKGLQKLIDALKKCQK